MADPSSVPGVSGEDTDASSLVNSYPQLKVPFYFNHICVDILFIFIKQLYSQDDLAGIREFRSRIVSCTSLSPGVAERVLIAKEDACESKNQLLNSDGTLNLILFPPPQAIDPQGESKLLE